MENEKQKTSKSFEGHSSLEGLIAEAIIESHPHEVESNPAVVIDFRAIYTSKSGKSFVDDPHDVVLLQEIEKALWRYRINNYAIFAIDHVTEVGEGGTTHSQHTRVKDTVMDAFRENPLFSSTLCYSHRQGRTQQLRNRSFLEFPDTGMFAHLELAMERHGISIEWQNSMVVGDREIIGQLANNAKLPWYKVQDFIANSRLL